uniref:Uncharacterized protein n=1 Tax=Brassica campestris TaxID=3711 RepID=M4ENU2_BRACM
MCLPISYPEDRKDVGELEKLLRSDLPDAKRMYRRCTQEKRPSLSQEWPVVRGMDQDDMTDDANEDGFDESDVCNDNKNEESG